jgi:hypothetical protein
MLKCARCGWIHVLSVNICNNCKAKFLNEKHYFAANKDILIDLSLKTKDEQWFKQLNMGVVADVE